MKDNLKLFIACVTIFALGYGIMYGSFWLIAWWVTHV